MTTALDLITGALRLIGAIASGETASPDEARDGLRALNDLLESLSAQQLTLYSTTDQVFAVAAGKAAYTLGPGGDWPGFRPVDIAGIYMRYGGVDYQVREIEAERYNAIALKQQQAPVAMYLYYNADMPQGQVVLWPVPSVTGVQIVLTCNEPLSALSSTAQALSLPPGYARALRYALAVELAPEFGIEPSATVVATRNEAMSAIKRANKRQPVLTCDDALVGGAGYGLANFMGGF
jgi:hypothetical protein